PEELIAANVASGTLQTIAILIAPAAAGLILATAGPAAVMAATAATCALSALLGAGIRVEHPAIEVTGASADQTTVPGDGSGPSGAATAPSWRPARFIDGLNMLRRHEDARTIVGLIAAGSVIEGALDVIAVVLSIEVLGLGTGGVGALG